jgi:hypothetical protein
MTTPTPDLLAEFAEAFAIVKAKWPDAPGLEPDYTISRFGDRVSMLKVSVDPHDGERYGNHVDNGAALALCVVTAIKFGSWWENEHGDIAHIYTRPGEYGWLVHILGREPHNSTHATLESACLAALRAMTKE